MAENKIGKIKLKRGLQKDLPKLDVGEPGFTTDTKKLFIGGTEDNVRIPSAEEMYGEIGAVHNRITGENEGIHGRIDQVTDLTNEVRDDLFDEIYGKNKVYEKMIENKAAVQKVNELLADKASKSELSALGQVKFEGSFDTLAALQSAKPTGATGLYLVITDGYSYRWNGTAWVRAAQFQSSGISTKSVDPSKISAQLQDMLVLGFEWESGTITTDGNLNSAPNRIRTKDRSLLEPGTTFEIEDTNYQLAVNQYNQSDGSYVSGSNTGWVRSFIVKTKNLYLITIRKTDDTDLTNSIKDTSYKLKGLSSNSIIRELKDKVPRSDINSPVTNLLKNGSFQSGTSEWLTVGATITSSTGNEVVVSTSGNNNRIYQPVEFNTGDIIYRSAFIKSPSNLVGIGVSGAAFAFHSGSNLYEFISDARSYNSQYTAILDTRAAGSPAISVSIKRVLTLNLTLLFGAGNEPTKSEMDAFVSGYKDRWFNGTVSSLDGRKKIEAINQNPFDAFIKAVAHRGFSAKAPENTLPAYQLAKEKGFAYVECDVRFSKDGVPVVIHDSTVNRTSNGTGNVNELTLSQLKELDFGAWKDPKYAGTKIPTLKEFVLYCKQQNLHPYIEIKEGGLPEIQTIYNVVKYLGMSRKVTWIGGYVALGHVVSLDQYARVGDGQSAINEATLVNTATLKTGKNEVFINCDHTIVNSTTSALAMDRGYSIEVWTVDTPSRVKELSELGVTGVTTNGLVIPSVFAQ